MSDRAVGCISVVIPTWNEESTIENCERSLRGQDEDSEIVVADGGSSDRTVAIAGRFARCVASPRGRGLQLNAGAAAARGDFFLFLHADCRLEAGGLEELRRLLADPEIKAGCFRQRVEARAPQYRFVEMASAARANRLGIVYGDCGLFLRRETFEEVGGFPPVPLFEDFGISQKLRKLPGRIAVARSRLLVSARRWRQKGFLRTTWLNWSLTSAYLRGESPERLAKRYGGL